VVNEEIIGKIMKSEEEWRHELDPESYRVLREKGTERAFSGKYNDFKEQGMFTCGACEHALFFKIVILS